MTEQYFMESDLLEIHCAPGRDCGCSDLCLFPKQCRKELPLNFEVEEQALCVACFNS